CQVEAAATAAAPPGPEPLMRRWLRLQLSTPEQLLVRTRSLLAATPAAVHARALQWPTLMPPLWLLPAAMRPVGLPREAMLQLPAAAAAHRTPRHRARRGRAAACWTSWCLSSARLSPLLLRRLPLRRRPPRLAAGPGPARALALIGSVARSVGTTA